MTDGELVLRGNRDILTGLGKVKTNVDSGAFESIQEAGIEALSGPGLCSRYE